MERKHIYYSLGIMAVVILTAVLFFSAGAKPSKGLSFTPNPNGKVLTFKEAYNFVANEFLNWSVDAKASQVFSTADGLGSQKLQGKDGRPAGWNFIFYSKSKGKKLSYFVGRDGQMVRGSEDAVLAMPVFDIDFVVDSSRAYNSARFSADSGIIVYDLTRSSDWGDKIIWFVSLRQNNQEVSKVVIDALSGEVLERK